MAKIDHKSSIHKIKCQRLHLFTGRFYLPQREQNLLIEKYSFVTKNCKKNELPLWTIGKQSIVKTGHFVSKMTQKSENNNPILQD